MSKEQIRALVQQLQDKCGLLRPAVAEELIDAWLRRYFEK